MEDKCTRCHGYAQICEKFGADKNQWLVSIAAMVRLGAKMNHEEEMIVAKCLESPKNNFNTKKLCQNNSN